MKNIKDQTQCWYIEKTFILKDNEIMVIVGSEKIKHGNKMWCQFSYKKGLTMFIIHKFKWRFRKTRCPSFFGKLSLSNTNNDACIDMILGLSRGELCDGFNVVEWYTTSRNIWEQKILQIILVFPSKRKVLEDEMI